jgi:isopentenyldiphosphate isomerase
MEMERLKIVDQNKNEIGGATREDVHRLGYWHETFHCWFTSRENGVEYIYFQRRSTTKKEIKDRGIYHKR